MSAKTSPLLLKIKKEVNEEIKEYAESAMNELLGWYGYCNSTNDTTGERFNNLANTKMSTPNFTTILSSASSPQSITAPHHSNQNRSVSASTSATGNNPKRDNSLSFDDIDNTTDSMSATDEITSKVSPQLHSKDLTTAHSDKSSPSTPNPDECGWCKRIIPFGTLEFSATPEGLKYCSESCFTQSRRASYKRGKTCDWCKHIRHAVSYVDFQDGASQLQFCSDKCLNQYKMQIFCKETQAHLELNPHLKDASKMASNENLITPDLWMRNCRSRSMTPDQRSNDSRASESPCRTTATGTTAGANPMPTIKVAPVSKLLPCDRDTTKSTVGQRHKRDESMLLGSHQKSRSLRKRRTNRLSSSSNSIIASGNMSEGSNNNDSSNENRNIHSAMHPITLINEKNRINNLLQPNLMPNLAASKISPSPAKNATHDEQSAAFLQRYQLMSPQSPHLFRLNENRSLQNALRQSAQFIAPISNHTFSDGSVPAPPTVVTGAVPPPEMLTKMAQMAPYAKLSPMHRQRTDATAAGAPGLAAHQHLFEPDNHNLFVMQQQQKSMAFNEFVSNLFGAAAPPSTLLIPYPIVLPLPLPIPIPLPYEAFLKAAAVKNPRTQSSANNHCNTSNSNSSTNDNDAASNNAMYYDRGATVAADTKPNDQPLDFTKEKISTRSASHISDDDSIDENFALERDEHNKCDVTSFKSDSIKCKTLRPHTINRTLTKEPASENNRPLRKRKRIIDCDYLRLRDANANESIQPRKSI